MPVRITLEPSGRVVGIASGPMTLRDVRDALRVQWGASPEPASTVLWDIRQVRAALGDGEVRDLVGFVLAGQGGHAPLRVGVVATGDVEFGLLRMYEAHRSGNGTDMRAFRNYDEAEAWTRPENLSTTTD